LQKSIRPGFKDLGLIFCNPEGDYQKPDQISSRVAEVTAKAGLRGISLHSLRHGHASQLLSEGVPIPTVSKRLGHANPAITLKLYSHALESDELAAAQRWDNAFAEVVQARTNPCGESQGFRDVQSTPVTPNLPSLSHENEQLPAGMVRRST
jgi:hypothetical protein